MSNNFVSHEDGITNFDGYRHFFLVVIRIALMHLFNL